MIDLNWNSQQMRTPTAAQTPMAAQTPTAAQTPMAAQTSMAARQQTATSPETYQQMVNEAENVNVELGDLPVQEIGYTQENIEMLEHPMSVQEAYQTSWKSLLAQNLGRYVVVSFLMGTQQTVVAEGILYEIGNDYLVLYQPVRDSYITADLYSVKFVEFRAENNRNTINSSQP